MQVNGKPIEPRTKEDVFAACNKISGQHFETPDALLLLKAGIVAKSINAPLQSHSSTQHANNIT